MVTGAGASISSEFIKSSAGVNQTVDNRNAGIVWQDLQQQIIPETWSDLSTDSSTETWSDLNTQTDVETWSDFTR